RRSYSVRRNALRSLADLVLDGRNRLAVLGDRQPVGLGQVLVTGQRALDDLAHEPAGDIAVGFVARAELVGDLLFGPLQACRLVGRDVAHLGALGALGIAGAAARVIVGHRHRAGRVASSAVTARAHEVFATGEP